MKISSFRRRGAGLPALALLALLLTGIFPSFAPASEQAANPYVLVADDMQDPLFERAWVDAEDFLLNGKRAGLHVMFQFSPERAAALQKEMGSQEPPLLLMTFFEVNREERTIRRGDYQILDAQGLPLSKGEGWAQWEQADRNNQGTLLIQVSDQLEEALRAQGRWSD